MNTDTPSQVRVILEDLSSIRSMERGKLTEYHRTRRAADGSGTVRLGPYHKLQTWEDKRNRTRHIPASEVPGLKRDLASHKEFKQLVGALEETIIADTRARRAGRDGPGGAAQDAKKNSARKRSSKNTAKPRASSPRRKSG